jgi:uncharacterized membrane protein YhiD involved in acid resistance
MTAGAGLYTMGVVGVVIVLLTLVGLRYVELRFPRRSLQHWQVCCTVADHGAVESVQAALVPRCRSVTLVSLQEDETSQATFSIEIARDREITTLVPALREAGARGVTFVTEGNAEVER